MNCNPKIVIFDLDETLGYYTEFGMFWDSIKEYLKSIKSPLILNQDFFNKTLDLYPEFNRPNIIKILNYLKHKKQTNMCHKILIYTNNQGANDWAKMIISYFESKINYKLFDQIICAFKIQGKQIEKNRTTHLKTYTDLLKCTKIPPDAEICFLDDVYYPGMNRNNVTYINLKPYEYDIKFDVMISRFINGKVVPHILPTSCREVLNTSMSNYAYIYVTKTGKELKVDKIVTKKALHHLHIFFNNHNGVTRRIKNKHKNRHKNKTIKKKNTN